MIRKRNVDERCHKSNILSRKDHHHRVRTRPTTVSARPTPDPLLTLNLTAPPVLVFGGELKLDTDGDAKALEVETDDGRDEEETRVESSTEVKKPEDMAGALVVLEVLIGEVGVEVAEATALEGVDEMIVVVERKLVLADPDEDVGGNDAVVEADVDVVEVERVPTVIVDSTSVVVDLPPAATDEGTGIEEVAEGSGVANDPVILSSL